MAKRKRASLKDKEPEELGLTPKKGKGFDLLFGGPVENNPEPEEETMPEEKTSEEPTFYPEEPDTELADILPETEVDELGLPVAMEAPPEDLQLASPEVDAFDPTLSPFSVPAEPEPTMEDNDLSGLLVEMETTPAAEEDLSGLGEEPPPEPEPAFTQPAPTPPDPTPSVPPPTGPDPAPLPIDDDLSGLLEEEPPETIPPANLSPAPPPPAAMPNPAPTETVTTPPPPPIPRIDSFEGLATSGRPSRPEDLLPEDTHWETGNHTFQLKEYEEEELDEALAAKVTRYIGQERRENLDREIEQLYGLVAEELSANKKDAEFALRILSEAQDYVFESPHEYDEALYRVAVVKTMLARKRNLRRWSYTWGLGVFFYGLVWLGLFLSGFLLTDILKASLGESSTSLTVVQNAWFSALSGGVGGILGIFYSLYWHVAMKQDFDRQYIMYYLVQPMMGFVLGAVVYFIIGAGFIAVNIATETGVSSDQVLGANMVIALQVLLGFIAGFRQRVILEMLDRIVQNIFPKDEKDADDSPVDLAPAEMVDKERESLALKPPGGF